MSKTAAALSASSAFAFVLTMGVVNLFADMTYEGASSINGPFLGKLGAGATTIGIVAGVGEFLGYSLRLFSGYVGDKSGRYWLVTFVGYTINLLAVPALSLAGNWPLAAGLMIAERVGRAIRKPTVEAMLSYTTGRLGKGWVYGVNTALDQLGATLGPLLVAVVLAHGEKFETGYGLLLIAALLALGTLALARLHFPNPAHLEATPTARSTDFTTSYWLFMLAGACVAAGLMSFEIISYHFSTTGLVAENRIPLLFALAMGTDALASLFFGKLFDRWGIPVVVAAFLLSSGFAPLVFSQSGGLAVAGVILWGIGFGAQDTLLKAIIAGLLPEGKRNLAFGLFYAGYGGGWLVGSVTTGLLYDRSLPVMIGFSIVVQLTSLPLFLLASRFDQQRRSRVNS